MSHEVCYPPGYDIRTKVPFSSFFCLRCSAILATLNVMLSMVHVKSLCAHAITRGGEGGARPCRRRPAPRPVQKIPVCARSVSRPRYSMSRTTTVRSRLGAHVGRQDRRRAVRFLRFICFLHNFISSFFYYFRLALFSI